MVFIETADGRFSVTRGQLQRLLQSAFFSDAYSLWTRYKQYGLGEPIEKKTNLEAQCLDVIEGEWNLYRKEKEKS